MQSFESGHGFHCSAGRAMCGKGGIQETEWSQAFSCRCDRAKTSHVNTSEINLGAEKTTISNRIRFWFYLDSTGKKSRLQNCFCFAVKDRILIAFCLADLAGACYPAILWCHAAQGIFVRGALARGVAVYARLEASGFKAA